MAILETAVKAASKAGRMIMQSASQLDTLNIQEKSPNDFVSEVDRTSENIIVSEILNVYPDHGFIGEEYGNQGNADSDYLWIIDPLDGTTNFLRGIPHFAVSIACSYRGVIQHAVVYDPAKDEQFAASSGQGAYLNGKQINVKPLSSIQSALVGTGVPFGGKNLETLPAFLQTVDDVMQQQTSGIRRMGAASLDLAYVAAGRLDGFWETNLNQWDIAAGVLLVQEAGGVVSDLAGEDGYMQSGNIMCGSPEVYKGMLPIVKQHNSQF